MKDIPVFTTENGAAGLVLREIPYRQRAYITIYDTQSPALLLEECAGFCRACGAETIFATGHPHLEQYPLAAEIVQMQAPAKALASCDAELIAVTSDTVQNWREISNKHMADVPLAAFFSSADDQMLVREGNAYFVNKEGKLVGIGKLCGNKIEQVVSLKPGCGETVVRALAAKVSDDTVCLTVATENARAMRLYQRLGFEKVNDTTRWHRIF